MKLLLDRKADVSLRDVENQVVVIQNTYDYVLDDLVFSLVGGSALHECPNIASSQPKTSVRTTLKFFAAQN